MGIINVTPDSFAEREPLTAAQAVALAVQMEAEGADIIDIGGESTRPGAAPVPIDEERRRVVPVVEQIAARVRIPVSVDTYKAAIAVEAVAAGADLVNDVSGLLHDPDMGARVAGSGAALVLMHTRGRSDTMYAEARYDDVIAEVSAELAEAVRRATSAGVRAASVIVDPGIGFAKRPEHSYGVLARVPELAVALGRPILVGASRKSFMAEAVGGRPAVERDWATSAAVTAAILGGAHVVRVHAVREMGDVVRVAERIRRHGRAHPSEQLS